MPLIEMNELTYRDKLLRLITVPLTREEFRAELAKMKRGTKKELSRMRAGMLKARMAFCAGTFLMTSGEQCKFEPVNQHAWREIHSARAMESWDLRTYLKQIGVLAPERKS